MVSAKCSGPVLVRDRSFDMQWATKALSQRLNGPRRRRPSVVALDASDVASLARRPKPAGKPRLGVALGGGAALGWAHIGILQVLDEMDLKPDLIVGTSMGAIVGAAYALDKIKAIEDLANQIGAFELVNLVADLGFGRAGILRGDRIANELNAHFGETRIEDLPLTFVAVAADLLSNAEVVLDHGLLRHALRATISLPGIFEPVVTETRVLVDGGMKNPVPVGPCRAYGADIVVAVDVAGDYRGLARANGLAAGDGFRSTTANVAAIGLNMLTSGLVQARLDQDPPDLLLVPEAGHLRHYDFHKAKVLIELGRQTALRSEPQLARLRDRLGRVEQADAHVAAGSD